MNIAKEVLQIAEILKQNDYSAYLVGGCLRDLLSEKTPKDWDLATDARPEEIQKLFPESIYENEFGTVGIKTDSENPTLKVIEVTTFRTEGRYTDKRRPDEVVFAKTIEEDLARRDFTVNALALSLVDDDGRIIDPFGGQEDLKNKIIRAVGDPHQRFSEDALRLMRAVRFSAQLGFQIEEGTKEAIQKYAPLLKDISQERIRIELEKTLMTPRGHEGIMLFHELGLLKYIIRELEEGVGVEQNQHHIYSVFEHNLRSLQYAVEQDYSLEIRVAALLHDVGKPQTRQWKASPKGEKVREGKRGDWTFYGHQVVGARMVRKILDRLVFSRKFVEKVSLLVYEHMFVYDPEVVTLSGVRRLLARVGEENVDDLIKLREADRIGSGVPKAQPYRLRHLMAMIEKVKTDPISAKMLAVDGQDLMKEAGIPPSRRLGDIIAILLEEVLDDPEQNKKDMLLERAKDLQTKTDKEITALAEKSKKRAQNAQEKIDEEIKSKYFVK